MPAIVVTSFGGMALIRPPKNMLRNRGFDYAVPMAAERDLVALSPAPCDR